MYIKVHDYNLESKVIINGKVNRGYVWFILRSLCYDFKKQKAKANKTHIGEGFDILDEYTMTDTMTYDDAYGLMLNKIDEELATWSHYDRKLFQTYSQSTYSLRGLGEATNINWRSILNTVTNCKERLKENVGEHYKYFMDEDYEKL
jgi:hypothetical protein